INFILLDDNLQSWFNHCPAQDTRTCYLVSDRKPENFFEYKAGENFNLKNKLSILRIKICSPTK
ncbi:MAG: hypothetical protein ABIJ31_07715, partial [Pseudomonadota bacterium]